MHFRRRKIRGGAREDYTQLSILCIIELTKNYNLMQNRKNLQISLIILAAFILCLLLYLYLRGHIQTI